MWYCKVNSGSKTFLTWLQKRAQMILAAKGTIHFEKYHSSTGYILKFSNKSAVTNVLSACYKNNCITLGRKRLKALQCLENLKCPGGEMVTSRDLKSLGL